MTKSTKLGKKEIVEFLSDDMDMSKAETESIFDQMFLSISEMLQDGYTVSIPRFGKFVVYQSAPRKGRNPATGETVNVPEKTKVKFKPSSILKESIQE
ncbi:MAG: HU family DNA-binding protein [bacterium]